jgi:S-formylglutathione hydrolase
MKSISISLFLVLALNAETPKASPDLKGSVEKITVHGKSLEGNLEGDSPDRTVFVYLPPSYGKEKNRRYPVVYFLHGYGIGAERYWQTMSVPEAADREMAGNVKEMILVHPDAFTKYDGSMYSTSPTTGDWDAYISSDLVSYIDTHYRTVAARESRGLAGHSMGGYGTLRIAMKHPDLYASIYSMSACCLMNSPQPSRAPVAPKQDGKAGGAFANVLFAEAAAWSPNPKNAPQFFDMPTMDGAVLPAIAAKWIANSPLALVDQYVPSLKKFKAITLDVGLSDTLLPTNKQMDESLNRLEVPHVFETYEGDHNNRVKERFAGKVLPFFSSNLVFPQKHK